MTNEKENVTISDEEIAEENKKALLYIYILTGVSIVLSLVSSILVGIAWYNIWDLKP